MAGKNWAARFLETKYFGLVIGFLVFLIIFGINVGTVLFNNLEQKLLDLNFRLRNRITATHVQEGVSVVQRDWRISPDILIVGVDERALARFGRWPFPRSRHADLVDAFARIKNQGERERAVFLDLFFPEPSETPADDALLVDAIRSNGRVFLETTLDTAPPPAGSEAEFFARQEILNQRFGTITNIKGDWKKVPAFLGLTPNLKPFARVAAGYGHPNFIPDADKTFRRQPLVARLPRLEEEISFDDLTVDTPVDQSAFERLAWMDRDGVSHDIPLPLTAAGLADVKRQLVKSAPLKVEEATDTSPARSYYVIRKYKDTFLPAITLSLALDYMNKKLSDIEVVLGQYILVPSPQKFNVDTQQWEPYTLVVTPPRLDKDGNVVKDATYRTLSELRIPIDEEGQLLLNYMGEPSSASPDGQQTFPVRS